MAVIFGTRPIGFAGSGMPGSGGSGVTTTPGGINPGGAFGPAGPGTTGTSATDGAGTGGGGGWFEDILGGLIGGGSGALEGGGSNVEQIVNVNQGSEQSITSQPLTLGMLLVLGGVADLAIYFAGRRR
jgi:hypothetical protein